jgi:hypothetical protein
MRRSPCCRIAGYGRHNGHHCDDTAAGDGADVRVFSLQGVGDTTDIIAMILLPVAVLMCAYALVVFLWRSGQIARKQVRFG